MPKVTYDQDQREAAKSRNVPLICVDFDARHCPKGSPSRARATAGGPSDSKMCREQLRRILTILDEKYPLTDA